MYVATELHCRLLVITVIIILHCIYGLRVRMCRPFSDEAYREFELMIKEIIVATIQFSYAYNNILNYTPSLRHVFHGRIDNKFRRQTY